MKNKTKKNKDFTYKKNK